MMSNSDRIILLVAFVLAVFLWGYSKVEIMPNERTRTFTNIPVVLSGSSPEGYSTSLSTDSKVVSLNIKGPIDDVNNMTADDIKVTVNIDGVSEGESVKTLSRNNIKFPQDIQGIAVVKYPKVQLITKKLSKKTLAVSVSFLTQPPSGFVIGQYVAEPSAVEIEGMTEAVENVAYVQVSIDPNKKLEEETVLTLHAVDERGDQVTDVRILTPTATIRMVTLTTEVPVL